MSNLLCEIDFDSPDIAALPEQTELAIFKAISDEAQRLGVHNWLDLYFAGIAQLQREVGECSNKMAHEIVIPIVSRAIEDTC